MGLQRACECGRDTNCSVRSSQLTALCPIHHSSLSLSLTGCSAHVHPPPLPAPSLPLPFPPIHLFNNHLLSELWGPGVNQPGDRP